MDFICVTLRFWGDPRPHLKHSYPFNANARNQNLGHSAPEWIWESRSAIVHGKTGEQGVIKALRSLPFNHRRRPKQGDNTVLRFCWHHCIVTCGNTY
ncbi:hypothetical protein BELL_0095g00070 [Botrytis elliptica]|uniref:Uncharacterized protein n=1 Tax=Botrytis elliptica TaxID=278938 RepID=A0A4Z1K196_9HELO|nr:hypothetical protein BELL_0095g00070 [Botrytis elliptica]